MNFKRINYLGISFLSMFIFMILTSLSIIYLINFYSNVLFTMMVILLYGSLSVLLIFSTKKISNQVFLTVFISVLFISQLIYIFKFKVTPISDFQYMLNGAKELVSGNFSNVYHDDYFFWYTTQLGYPIFESFILKLGDGSIYSLQIVNLLFIDGTTLILYFISNKLFNNFSARVTTWLYGSYIGLFLFSSVLSNQHGGVFFIFGALLLWLYNEENSYKKIFTVGVLISIGNIFYPIGILFIVALVLYTLFLLKESFNKSIIMVFFLISGYIFPIAIISLLIVNLGISAHGINHYDNYWKFVLGLNQKTNGQYSLEDFNYLKESYLSRNEVLHEQLEKKLIMERLHSKRLVKLFISKSLSMWSAPDDSYMYTQLPPFRMKNANDHFTIIIAIAQYFIIYIFGLFFSIIHFGVSVKDKIYENRQITVFLMVIIGGFLIYLIIEQQVRYRYFFTPIFALFAGSFPYYITTAKSIKNKMT